MGWGSRFMSTSNVIARYMGTIQRARRAFLGNRRRSLRSLSQIVGFRGGLRGVTGECRGRGDVAPVVRRVAGDAEVDGLAAAPAEDRHGREPGAALRGVAEDASGYRELARVGAVHRLL
jgi:hypothetical protein